jgi:2'-hydroxyisoflavone reductase
MRMLILGGTVFLGRALIDAAHAAGHTVTLFNRGKSNPAAIANVEQVHGDRATDLERLAGRTWDAVIDTCGYVPRIVRLSAQALARAAPHYTFISTLSVYRDVSRPRVDEDAPLGELADPAVEQVNGETYGPLKALCEAAVTETLPGRTLIIRPGLIVGPHDPTDRFSYWPHRVAQGGEVLAPGTPASGTQFIDVRDLAEWTVDLAARGVTGTYNATSEPGAVTMGELLETCRTISGSDATFTWAPGDFLLAQGVQPWSDMPLWVPQADPAYGGFNAMNVERALAAGLAFRPLADTVAATLAWLATRPADHAWRAGIDRIREQELLAAYRS